VTTVERRNLPLKVMLNEETLARRCAKDAMPGVQVLLNHGSTGAKTTVPTSAQFLHSSVASQKLKPC
jgi:hypothetical protein